VLTFLLQSLQENSINHSTPNAENGSTKSSTQRNCPACDSADWISLGTKGGFELLECRQCRTLYTSSLPHAEAAENYGAYYHEGNLTIPEFINHRLDEIVSKFDPYRQSSRLLDVGFGAGTLLEAARRAGWQTSGVDVAQSAVEHVRGLGFEVFCGTLQDAHYPENHFDVVTASEFLEHVPEPQRDLGEIARVLRPGGLLWMTTPHACGISALMLGLKWSVVRPPEHLQLFSIGGAKRMLEQNGFRCLGVATEGVNPYELMQGLRANRIDNPDVLNERVLPGYQLNEALLASKRRRLLRSGLNSILNLSRSGDSLKIWAQKKEKFAS
jgi:SAM-dependent methyltransferase